MVLIVSDKPEIQRRTEVTCRALPESIALSIACVSSLAQMRELVESGNVLVVYLDENLLAEEPASQTEYLFPKHPFIQTIAWNPNLEVLSTTTLARSLKIASLTNEQRKRWQLARNTGMWH